MRPLDPAFDLGSGPATRAPGARLDFAMLAHDIRGALQGVLGGLAAIRDEDVSPPVREELRRVTVAAQLIEELSGGLASLGRAPGTAADASDPEVEMAPFLAWCRNRWSGEARPRGIAFEVLAAPNLPARLRVARLPLARVLGNLIVNALTHAGQGTVRLEADRGTGGGVVFRLTDEGPGLSESALRTVSALDPEEIAPNEAGHGLGLHIVRSLTRQIGGRVTVRNRPEGGVQAVLEFPPGLSIEGPAPEAQVPRDRVGLAGVRVLLAEDNPTNQMVATQMLGILGAEVTLASDGVEALELFENREFDIVVVDIEMPRMTGLDVIRTIRARGDRRARTPIVALTAYALREHRERIAGAGADGLISKPITSIEALARGLAPHVGAAPRPTPPPPVAPLPQDDAVVDRVVYESLAAAIGAEMMTELLEKVAADLTSARTELSAAREPLNYGPIRSASHILISVAGAVGAVRLQHCARRLNTAAISGDEAATADLVPACIAEIDAAVAFTAAERAGT